MTMEICVNVYNNSGLQMKIAFAANAKKRLANHSYKYEIKIIILKEFESLAKSQFFLEMALHK